MSSEPRKPHQEPIPWQVGLIQSALEKGTWPAVAVVLIIGGSPNLFLKLLLNLLENGAIHFWAFIGILLFLMSGFAAFATLDRRRTRTLEEQVARNQELIEENEHLLAENERLRERLGLHPGEPLADDRSGPQG